MKKISTLLVVAFGLFAMNAQDFRGVATYVSKTSTDDIKLDSPQITPEMKEMIQEQMRLMSEKTFTLSFDKNTSLYEEEVVLAPGGGGMFEGMRMMSNTMYGGVYYKNTKDKVFIQEREIFGKEFLIKDSLQVFEWQLGTETKQVGNYMCYKATAVVPFDLTDFKNMTRKEAKDDKEKEEQENSTNFLDMIDVPSEVVITAWYTPQIPIAQGPSNYWGLPGLIMEISSGKTTILCSKLVINPKDKKEIKVPKNGKVVTQKEFQEIMMEKMEELQKMGRGQGRRGRGF
ncbi:MAG TPA: GLPGLI family protein [Flavobacterium sp.]|nr:GLPGLI family protein [Flavobacterium sp.]